MADTETVFDQFQPVCRIAENCQLRERQIWEMKCQTEKTACDLRFCYSTYITRIASVVKIWAEFQTDRVRGQSDVYLSAPAETTLASHGACMLGPIVVPED
jgi:hypothetical protein